MLHQPQSSLSKAAELKTLLPWFQVGGAKELIADCVANPPARHLTSSKDMQAGMVPSSFDESDKRIMQLRAFREGYYEAVAQLNPELVRAMRTDIGPTEAIDLAAAAARDASPIETLRDRLLAQGLTIGEADARVAAAKAAL